ncbi:MAG: hypothetical protein QMD99_04045 [Rhizobiaceae bacterium]|nr:hypothetical protein [Rhizobiaceae bacterium]
MADRSFFDLVSPDLYANELRERGYRLPFAPDPDDMGSVLDAGGNHVFTVDVNSDREDADADATRRLIITAVNHCAGFKTEAR